MALVHRHMIGTAYLSNPPKTSEAGEKWLTELVALVGMNVLIPAKAVYCDARGNEGVTGIVCLETSHASFHSWSELKQPFMSFDLYSCKEFDPNIVINHLRQFGLLDVDWKLIERDPK